MATTPDEEKTKKIAEDNKKVRSVSPEAKRFDWCASSSMSIQKSILPPRAALTARMNGRWILAPKVAQDLFEVCADLVAQTFKATGGNILVFLPGMQEIQQVRQLLHTKTKASSKCQLPTQT